MEITVDMARLCVEVVKNTKDFNIILEDKDTRITLLYKTNEVVAKDLARIVAELTISQTEDFARSLVGALSTSDMHDFVNVMREELELRARESESEEI
jgi:intein-encoded DNA endonuclease-like protein